MTGLESYFLLTDLACKCAAQKRGIFAGGVGHGEGVIGAGALDSGGC